MRKKKDEGDWKEKYDKALNYFNKKKYSKALEILDEIIPSMILDDQIVDARFKQAYCSFQEHDYDSSIYQFDDFYNDFASLPDYETYIEEALYLWGASLSKLSRSIHMEQGYTEKAIEILKNYKSTYSNGKFIDEVTDLLEKLSSKLYLKELNIIDTYIKLEHFNAAKVWLEPIISKAPTNELMLESEWKMLNILFEIAKLEKTNWPKWLEAKNFCVNFLDIYNDSKYIKKARKIYDKILSNLNE